MNEIALRDLQVNYVLPSITFDIKPLQDQVDSIIKEYDGWVVIEQDIATAKNVSAALNNTAKALSDKRIAIVKDIKLPIDNFEFEIKALVQKLKDVATGIKTQIDNFTEAEKEHKRQVIIDEMGYASYMTFDDKWLNKGTSRQTIEKEIEVQRKLFEANVEVIKAKCEQYGLDLNKYLIKLTEKKEITEIIELIKNDYEVKNTYIAPIKEEQKIDVKAVDDECNFVLEIVTTPEKLNQIKKYLSEIAVKFKEL